MIGALIYRATLYWLLPPSAGEAYGPGDIIDFALGLILFFVGGFCAVCAVALSTRAEGAADYQAFRPAAVGMTSFVVYYFLHPYVPRLL